MSFEFNIPSVVYSDTFGIYGQIAKYPGVTTGNESGSSAADFLVPRFAKTEAEVLSSLGTPVESPLYFQSKPEGYRKFNLKGELIRVVKDEIMLPPTTLIELSQDNIVGVTAVNNGNEEITSFYGQASYRLRIYGICLPEKNKSAQEQYSEILAFKNLADSIKVSSAYLLEHGITEITILRMSSGQVKGSPNARAFQIEAKSEKPSELIIQ